MASENYRDYCDSASGVYPDESFEGLLIEHRDNGNMKYRGQFEKGRKRIGQHLAFAWGGALEEVSYWDQGWICGTRIRFDDDGYKEEEADFGEDGGRTRSWIERRYHRSAQPWMVCVYKDDAKVDEWISPETLKMFEEINADRIVKDAVRLVYPDE